MSGATTWYADDDGDRYGDASAATLACSQPADTVTDATDCDDSDAAVSPTATELCDSIDNDCDGDIDEAGAYGRATWYADIDEDGYGDPTTSADACDAPSGYVSNDSDCDDGDATVNPDATDLPCNGLDEDCDGSADADTVPTHYATIEDAADALADGSTICLEPGTYSEQLDLSGRTLTITSQDGGAATILDPGSSAPMITVDNTTAGVDSTTLTISGLTFSGADIETGTQRIDGGVFSIDGAALVLEDVLLEQSSFTANDASLAGGFVAVYDGTLMVDGLEVSEVDLVLEEPSSASSVNLFGGVFVLDGSEAIITDVTVTGLDTSSSGAPGQCNLYGGFLQSQDSEVSLEGIRYTDSHTDISCEDIYVYGPVLDMWSTIADVTDLEVEDSSVTTDAADYLYSYGLVRCDDCVATLEDVALSDNVVGHISVSTANDYGALYLSSTDADISGLALHGNVWTVVSESRGRGNSYGLIYGTDATVTADHVDIRGNDISATNKIVAGAAYLRGSLVLDHFIIAGNTIEADYDVDTAGINLYTQAPSSISYGDITGNSATAGIEVYAGGLYLNSADSSIETDFHHINIVDNTVYGRDWAAAAAMYVKWSAYIGDWEYNNVYGNTGSDTFYNFTDPTGSDGNLSVDPWYADTSSSDASAWDMNLSSSSSLIDAGDPSVTDDDGTTSDIGAYGGPGGSAW